MNKVNYVPGRELTSADLNAIQDGIEGQLGEMASILLPGRVSGLEVSGAARGLSVSAGYGWDSQGRRLRASVDVDVNTASVQRPAAGRFRWLLVHASYRRVARGTVTDVANTDRTAYYDDSVAIATGVGPEFAAADIDTARGTAAGRPAAPEGAVGLGLLILDHATTWDVLGDAAARPARPAQPVEGRWAPGDIRPWPGPNAPDGWALCDGTAVSRAGNPVLFSAIGVTWGHGDRNTTFNIPDLRGRVLLGADDTYNLGSVGGETTSTLTVAQIPSHTHHIGSTAGGRPVASGAGSSVPNTGSYTDPTGGGQPHNNMQPYAAVQWIIRLG